MGNEKIDERFVVGSFRKRDQQLWGVDGESRDVAIGRPETSTMAYNCFSPRNVCRCANIILLEIEH